MPARFVLGSLVAAALVACAPAAGEPDAGPAVPHPERFGLAENRCSVFQDANKNDYTTLVERDSKSITGVDAWRVTHRANGFRVRIDYFDLTEADELKLLRTQKWPPGNGADDTLWRFRTPATFLDDGVRLQRLWETDVTADVSGGMIANEVREIAFKSEVVEEGEFAWEGGTVPAFKVVVTMAQAGGALVVDRLWFAPGTGVVRFDPDGNELKEVSLKSVRTLPVPPGLDTCSQ